MLDHFAGVDVALQLHESAFRLYATQLDSFAKGSAAQDVGGTYDAHTLRLTNDDRRLACLGGVLTRLEKLVGFFAATVPERQEPTPGDDAADARWVHLDEISTLASVDGLLDFLRANRVVD